VLIGAVLENQCHGALQVLALRSHKICTRQIRYSQCARKRLADELAPTVAAVFRLPRPTVTVSAPTPLLYTTVPGPGGGGYPVWSRHGQELFFRTADDKIIVAAYTVTVHLSERDSPVGQTWILICGSATGASPMFNRLPGAMLALGHMHQ
jgi:hypothetical protein